MKTDGKPLIAIILCLVFYVGYTKYLESKYPGYGNPKKEQLHSQSSDANETKRPEQQTTSAQKPESREIAQDNEFQKLSPEELTFDTASATYVFNQDYSALVSVRLKNYSQSFENRDIPLELLDSPLKIQATNKLGLKEGVKGFSAVRSGRSLLLSRTTGPWSIEQKFTVSDDYTVDLEVTWYNKSSQSEDLTGGLYLQGNMLFPTDSGGFGPASFVAQQKAVVYGHADTYEQEFAREYCEDEEGGPVAKLQSEQLDFVGIDNHYFLSLVKPDSKSSLEISKLELMQGNVCRLGFMMHESYGLVEAGSTVKIGYEFYFGPKDVDVLVSNGPHLKKAVNFGIFSFLGEPLLFALKWIYGFVGNWGIAIILLTFLIKVVFYPLNKASHVSMQRMKVLNPEMTKIREKFKDDPQRQQREIMRFMSENKINPMKGCLPILPQMPVFFAYYSVLSQAIEFRHAPFFGWIEDLSVADPYYISPLLLGVGMFFQQKLTPNPSMDKNQERIMLMMPVIFTVMMLTLPAGMVIYMLANTIVSIAQQQWLNRKLDSKQAPVGKPVKGN